MLGASGLAAAQVRFNAAIVGVVHNPAEVAVINQGLQVVVTSLVIAVSLSRRQAWRRTFAGLRSGALRPWEILGGLLGAYFIAIQSISATLIGVAAFTVSFVTGQTAMGAFADRVGLGPAGRQRLTALRLGAIAVAVVAVVVTMWERLASNTNTEMLWLVILALSAGAASGVQMALNGRVTVFARQPLVSAWMNFTVGACGMLVVMLIVNALGGWHISGVPVENLWLMLGPMCGLVYIATAAWAVPILGVLVMSLVSVAGQFLGALVLDLVVPTAGVVIDPSLFVGLGLALVAAAMGAFGRARPPKQA